MFSWFTSAAFNKVCSVRAVVALQSRNGTIVGLETRDGDQTFLKRALGGTLPRLACPPPRTVGASGESGGVWPSAEKNETTFRERALIALSFIVSE